jgi:Spy/CpxP family protein refolding chaperone
MKKFNLTALSVAICGVSIVATATAPSLAQQSTTTPPATTKTAPATTSTPSSNGTNPQAQAIEQLKLTKDQQAKLVKLQQTVMQQKIAVLTPSQKEQVQLAMKQGKTPNLTLTADQQTQLKAIQAAAIAQQDAILTPEQKLKLQEINKQYTAPQK